MQFHHLSRLNTEDLWQCHCAHAFKLGACHHDVAYNVICGGLSLDGRLGIDAVGLTATSGRPRAQRVVAQGQSAAWRKTADGQPPRKKRKRTGSRALAVEDNNDEGQGSPGHCPENDNGVEAGDGVYVEIDDDEEEESCDNDGSNDAGISDVYEENNTSDDDNSGEDLNSSDIEGDQDECHSDGDDVDADNDDDSNDGDNYDGNEDSDNESDGDECNDGKQQPPSATDAASTGAHVVDKREGRKRRLPAALTNFVLENPPKKVRLE